MSRRDDDYKFDTLAIRAGQVRSAEGEHSEAVYPTSSYVFASAAQAAARFSGDQPRTRTDQKKDQRLGNILGRRDFF